MERWELRRIAGKFQSLGITTKKIERTVKVQIKNGDRKALSVSHSVVSHLNHSIYPVKNSDKIPKSL